MTSSSAQHPLPGRSTSSSSVLFVSELLDEVAMYSAALELSGFRTVHVRTPLQALNVGEEPAPIAVILDAGRSRGGLASETAQHLGLRAKLRVPIILLTTHATAIDPNTPRRIGCDRVLMKPCLPDALVQALEDVLGPCARAGTTLARAEALVERATAGSPTGTVAGTDRDTDTRSDPNSRQDRNSSASRNNGQVSDR